MSIIIADVLRAYIFLKKYLNRIQVDMYAFCIKASSGETRRVSSWRRPTATQNQMTNDSDLLVLDF